MKKAILAQRLKQEYFPKHSKRKVYNMVNFLLSCMRESMSSEVGLKISGFGSLRKKGKRIAFKPSKKLLLRLKSEPRRSKM